MINCLRYASYEDIGASDVRDAGSSPLVREGLILLLTLTFEQYHKHTTPSLATVKHLWLHLTLIITILVIVNYMLCCSVRGPGAGSGRHIRPWIRIHSPSRAVHL
jgi:hypothetical protein